MSISLSNPGGGGGGGGLGTAAYADTGTGLTNVILGDDPRLTDDRTPSDGSVLDVKIPSNAAIQLSKLERIPDAYADANVGIPANGYIPVAFSGSYVSPAQDRIYWGRPQTVWSNRTAIELAIRVQANFPSGKSIRLYMYSCTDAGIPNALMVESAAILADSGAPVAKASAAISQAVARGIPFILGVACDGNAGSTGTVACHQFGVGGVASGSSTSQGRLYTASTFGPGPATISSVVWESGNPMCPVVKFS